MRMDYLGRLMVAVLISQLVHATDPPSWHYYGADGPGTWATGYPKCGLTHQSPINIPTSRVKYNASLTDITFTGYGSPWQTATFMLENNGHAAEVVVEGEELQISGGGLPYEYQLDEFHFHWGTDSSLGSEHALDEDHFPLEMHMVHFSTAYENITAADDGDDHSIAVLAFFFEIQEENNTALEDMITHIQSVQYMGQSSEIQPFAVNSLLPSDLSHYYRYSGSFTTPPCYESVVWTVFEETIKISETQISAFREMYFTAEAAESPVQMTDNFRPLQDLHDREITSSNMRYKSQDSASDGNKAASILPYMVVGVLGLLLVV